MKRYLLLLVGSAVFLTGTPLASAADASGHHKVAAKHHHKHKHHHHKHHKHHQG